MEGRNNAGNNKPLSLYSDAEIIELAKKMAVNNSQFTEEDYIKLIKSSYVPKETKVVRIDQEHDVIYYAAEEDNLNEPERSRSPKNSNSPTKQSGSTQQIYNTLCNSSVLSDNDDEFKKLAEFNKYNDFFLSHKNNIPIPIEQKKDALCLVEKDNSKDDSKNSIKNEKSKESTSYKHLGLGLMVGICSYLALNDSRISIAFSAIAGISSWLIFSNNRNEASERPMQRIEYDIPDGYKRMTMWSHELQDFCIGTVPENTLELTSEEYKRYSSINPK